MGTQPDTNIKHHRQILEKLTQNASQGPAQDYEYFLERVKQAITDHANLLPAEEKANFLNLAINEFAYNHVYRVYDPKPPFLDRLIDKISSLTGWKGPKLPEISW